METEKEKTQKIKIRHEPCFGLGAGWLFTRVLAPEVLERRAGNRDLAVLLGRAFCALGSPGFAGDRKAPEVTRRPL